MLDDLHLSTTICKKRLFQVADLLGKHPDLMEGFNEFLERCERIGNSGILSLYKCFTSVGP